MMLLLRISYFKYVNWFKKLQYSLLLSFWFFFPHNTDWSWEGESVERVVVFTLRPVKSNLKAKKMRTSDNFEEASKL